MRQFALSVDRNFFLVLYLRRYDSLLCYDYSVVVPSYGVLPSMAHDPDIGLLVCFGVGL